MKLVSGILASVIFLAACENTDTPKDSVETADTVNEAKPDTSAAPDKQAGIAVDEQTDDFMVKAMDGRILEINANDR